MPRVNVVTPSGRTISVEESQLPDLEAQGYRRQTSGEEREQAHEQFKDRYYNTLGQKVATVLEGGLRGLTGGLSDLIADGDPFLQEEMLERRERHGFLSGVSEIGGSILGSGKIAGGVGRLARGSGQTA